MVRSISAASLAKLNQKLGTEPANIIEIDWGNGLATSYADITIGNIAGKILEIDEIDHLIDVFNSNSSQEVSFRLSDTDGEVKRIFNTQEIQEVPVRIFQWFVDLDVDEKFLIFAGKISSPIKFEEADRSFTFGAISEIEDKEFGFSAEEGQFEFIPSDLVGQPWPSVFGLELDVPALQVNKAITGTLLCPIGIVSGQDKHLAIALGGDDCGMGMSVSMISTQISFLNVASTAWSTSDKRRSEDLFDQANELRKQLAQVTGSRQNQIACAQSKRQQTVDDAENVGLGCNPARILGGEDFPANTSIQLEINGGILTGSFNDPANEDSFFISSRRHPDSDTKAESQAAQIKSTACIQPTPAQFFDFSMEVPPGRGQFGSTPPDRVPLFADDGKTIVGTRLVQGPDIVQRKGFIICNLPASSTPPSANVLQHFWADAGSRVTRFGDEPITFIVSITPGEVLAVKAFKNFNGEKRLVSVPDNLWSDEVKSYGPVVAVQVTTSKPLSTIEDEGWEDQIYVTFESTIGPNPVDILEYIIENYTDLIFDTVSFDAVKASLDNNGDVLGNGMVILERINTVELLRQITFLNRCAIWATNGVFRLKYLPLEPPSDLTITTSDFRFKSVVVSTVDTEDLVTKMIVEWRLSESEEEPQKILLRNNVSKYGTKEETFDWFTHNQPDIIYKAATFWLIRLSNSWKRIEFDGFMHLLQLETFDTVTLDLPDYVATGPIKAIVEEARYDSLTQSIKVKCLVPVRTGEMTEYPLFWPALKGGIVYPIEGDEDDAGGSGIGEGAFGELPIGDTSTLLAGKTIFIGGPNVVFGSQSDRGDRLPADVGFVPQPVIVDGAFANVDGTPNPQPGLGLNFVDPFPGLERPDVGFSTTQVIDIRRTKIIDSNFGNASTTLDSIFFRIFNGRLEISTGAAYNNSIVNNAQPADWKFDVADEEWGAGTAFLED